VGEIFGEVMRENHKMLELCRALGFTISAAPDAPELVHAHRTTADWPGGAKLAAETANPG
jgi:hypothetical protein